MPKRKRLMFPMKCDKCGREPEEDKKESWVVLSMNCPCGGRVQIDYNNPYYEYY